MSMLSTEVLDGALAVIEDNVTVLHICSSEPSNYAGVAGVSLGTKTTPTFTGPGTGDTSGRKLTIDAISDGTVSATGTAGYWALVDADTLYAAGALSATQAVTSGNTFTLTAFDIEIQDPA